MKEQLPVWDLNAIYASPEAWEADFARLKGLAEAFAAYRGRLAESPEVLKQAMEADEASDRMAEKLYIYAHLKSDENTADSAAHARLDRIKGAFAELSPLSAWFMPELSALPEEVMKRYIASPVLADRRRVLEEILRARPHVLSEPEEKIIGLYSDVLRASENTFSLLNDADMTFGTVLENGKRRELTHASYHAFLESADRTVRRTAFRKMHGAFGKLRNTFASTLDASVKKHVVSARLRKYPSALAAALFDDEIPEQVYTNLIDTVHANLPQLSEYIALRKKVLNISDIDIYDLYNPLLPDCRKTYSWQEATDLVRGAIRPLGEEYGRIWEKAFAERWIHAPVQKGKRSGAYSSGCFDTYPYLLLSFDHTLNDVFTLAHEGGHSMHSYFSNHSQPYQYADYCIFAAEIASTTNEFLLSDHLLKQHCDRELKAYLLCHIADEIRTTIYRQTMFAEFELWMHRKAEAGVPLTADLLDEEYYRLNTAYYGISGDKLIRHEWARIPHFYYNFYVYKYATGMSAAIRLATGLLNGGETEREKYLGFLKAGSCRDVLSIMRSAGVDLSTPEPVDAALKYFARIVQELHTLL